MNNMYLDDLKIENIKETMNELPKIKLIGVGGGGGNMLNYISLNIENKIGDSIDLIAMNTDVQALNQIKINPNNKIELGKSLARGMGAGMRPEVGKQAALESKENIVNVLKDTDILFISGGLGGGTATGALPEIAKIAKELNILTIAVVTKPFSWEGKRRSELAIQSLREIEKIVDSLIVIPNDKLLEIEVKNNKEIGLKDAFTMVNQVLSSAVFSIASLIVDNSENNINLDFADVSTIMKHRGKALMTVGKGNTCEKAILNAIESPLLESFSIDGSKGVLVNFRVNPNIGLLEIHKGMEIVHDKVADDAEIIFGTIYDINMEVNQAQVTIVATGFDSERIKNTIEMEKMIEENNNCVLESVVNIEERVSKNNEEIYKINTKIKEMAEIPTFLRKNSK